MAHDEAERKALGAQLAKIRVEAGYTLDTASEALEERGHKIGRGAIGAWETGRNVPDALWLRRLARLYDVPVDAMFSDAPVSLEEIRLAARLRDVVLQGSSPAPSADESTLRKHSVNKPAAKKQRTESAKGRGKQARP